MTVSQKPQNQGIVFTVSTEHSMLVSFLDLANYPDSGSDEDDADDDKWKWKAQFSWTLRIFADGDGRRMLWRSKRYTAFLMSKL